MVAVAGVLTLGAEEKTGSRPSSSLSAYDENFSASAAFRAADKFTPSFVANDRRVLRFYGYYRDASSPSGFEVRKVTLNFYLEDGSTRVSEEKDKLNPAGFVTSGELIKRHRVPKAEGGFFEESDFFVGAQVDIYKKHIVICSCDEFTSSHLQSKNMPWGPPLLFPDDYVPPRDKEVKHSHGRVNEMSGRSPSRTGMALARPFPGLAYVRVGGRGADAVQGGGDAGGADGQVPDVRPPRAALLLLMEG